MFQNGSLRDKIKDNGNGSGVGEWTVRNSASNVWDGLREQDLNREFIGTSFKKAFKFEDKFHWHSK